jgi:hypothetical protein
MTNLTVDTPHRRADGLPVALADAPLGTYIVASPTLKSVMVLLCLFTVSSSIF